jgi:putative redox protein
MTVHSHTEQPPQIAQTLEVGAHRFRADVSAELFGESSAPSPHDYFDASLAACKTLTAHWFARMNGLALERVEVEIERDTREERKGRYVLKLHIAFHGALSDEDKQRLYTAVAKCPVHKLMTTTEVEIQTAPLVFGEPPPPST